MNKDIFKGSWNELKGKVKEKWGRLTDNDLTTIDGKRDQLVGRLQKTYGYAKDRAEKEISEWEKSFSAESRESETVKSNKSR